MCTRGDNASLDIVEPALLMAGSPCLVYRSFFAPIAVYFYLYRIGANSPRAGAMLCCCFRRSISLFLDFSVSLFSRENPARRLDRTPPVCPRVWKNKMRFYLFLALFFSFSTYAACLLLSQAAGGVASRGAPEDSEASEAAARSQLEEVKVMQEKLVALTEATRSVGFYERSRSPPRLMAM